MVQILFFLRYKTQLRRTRPDLIKGLENLVSGALAAAGGKIAGERRLLTASFDEESLGFWLDILVLIERIKKPLEEGARDLYGYALALGHNLEEASAEQVCRLLSSDPRGGGVWLDARAKKGLSPYVTVEKSGHWENLAGIRPRDRALVEGFARLESLKNFSAPRGFPLRETVQRALSQGARRNTVLIGPRFSGKRQGLYQFYQDLCFSRTAGAEDIPPLIIRFDAGGLSSLADAWSPRLRSLIAGNIPAETLREMEALGKAIFRDRLRDEISPDGMSRGRRFFKLLLNSFVSAVKRPGIPPLVILENIHLTEEAAARIFLETYEDFPRKAELLILGTCSEEKPDVEEQLKIWGTVFSRVIKLNAEGPVNPGIPEMPPELWEMSYAFSLLGRYFPGGLFPRLFEEAGKNPAMFSRALSLLSLSGLIDSPGDPQPRICDFIPRAEKILGNRKEKVRALVRERLLDWVGRGELNPCFKLLEAQKELGGSGGDELIQQSIFSDIINGTYKTMEQALSRGTLEKITGPERIKTIGFIIKTLKALLYGDEEHIRSAFQEVPPDCSGFPVFKAQVLANLSCYFLGIRDVDSAGESVKEGIVLSQVKNGPALARSYRLFSLVNLSRQRIADTIDYLGFAVDNAEKSGNYHELSVSTYYAAAAQFLFGNISRAQRLAGLAEDHALAAGNSGWADRSRFFRGRLFFETGRYREALEIFEGLGKNCSGKTGEERLLAAWTYRAEVYGQNPRTPKPAGKSPDADLFEIEAAYLAGDYEKAAELSSAPAGFPPDEGFLYTEQPDWRSGFAQAEFLLFPRKDLWDRIVSVYHALAICRLSPSGGEEALHTLHRVLRDERLSEIDPWDAFCFFAWYRVLEETGAAQVDMNTAVSMAFKRLQRRASRVDDLAVRRDFLSLPRWNSALSLAAREYKLI
jgi:tetratricopeptide (TPR) repeat protein